MTTVTQVNNGEQAVKLAEATKNGARTLSGGLIVPAGTYRFTTAETKAFGILNVNSATSGQWALPIVAGTMKVEGKYEIFVINNFPDAKHLVIPDVFFVKMLVNTNYHITIENRKGRNVVSNVEMAVTNNVISETEVQKPTKIKKSEPAF